MKETNDRLQSTGYKLDSREEENAKIKVAFASFSYDTSATTTASSQKGGRKKNSMKGKEWIIDGRKWRET